MKLRVWRSERNKFERVCEKVYKRLRQGRVSNYSSEYFLLVLLHPRFCAADLLSLQRWLFWWLFYLYQKINKDNSVTKAFSGCSIKHNFFSYVSFGWSISSEIWCCVLVSIGFVGNMCCKTGKTSETENRKPQKQNVGMEAGRQPVSQPRSGGRQEGTKSRSGICTFVNPCFAFE